MLPPDKTSPTFLPAKRPGYSSSAAKGEAPAPSAVDTPVFASLSAVVAETFGGVPTAPYLVLGATDARHYTAICDQVFRFSPVLVTSEEMATVHGIGEHIPVEKMAGMVRFYNTLIPAWTGGSEA